jgi:hypothetical protein
MNAFKARDRPLRRHRRARRPTSPASLRVPLFIIGTPVFKWIYAKASELRGWQGDVDKVAGWSHTCLFCRARLALAGVGRLGRGLLQLQRAAGRAVPALAGTGRLGPGRPWMAAVATVMCSGPPVRRRRLPPREARAGHGLARGRAGASTDGALVGLRSPPSAMAPGTRACRPALAPTTRRRNRRWAARCGPWPRRVEVRGVPGGL